MMRRQFEFHPDLSECLLEDRLLLALPPGLAPSPFMSINSATNQMVPSGTSGGGGSGGGGGGGLVSPGPTYFYLRIGVNLGGMAQAGSSLGGTVSVFGLNTRATVSGGGGGGGGGGNSGGSGRNGTGANSGFGANFSAGYSFALSSLNNFGTNFPTLGSVPVHTYGGGGDPVADAPANSNDSGNPPEGNPNDLLTPQPGTDNVDRAPSGDLVNRSLGKSRDAAASLLQGPALSNRR